MGSEIYQSLFELLISRRLFVRRLSSIINKTGRSKVIQNTCNGGIFFSDKLRLLKNFFNQCGRLIIDGCPYGIYSARSQAAKLNSPTSNEYGWLPVRFWIFEPHFALVCSYRVGGNRKGWCIAQQDAARLQAPRTQSVKTSSLKQALQSKWFD